MATPQEPIVKTATQARQGEKGATDAGRRRDQHCRSGRSPRDRMVYLFPNLTLVKN